MAAAGPDGMRRSGDGFKLTVQVRMLHAAVVRLGREERKARLETLYGELMQERGFRQMVGVIFGGADQ